MKRLIETVKDWLRYDDIMAKHGSDGGENDSNWDNAKVAMSRLVQEPLKVYETVIVRDLEDWGLTVNTEVFCDLTEARKRVLDEIKSAAKGLYLSEPGPGEMIHYEDEILAGNPVILEHDDSSITFMINEKEIKDGSTDSGGERH